MSSLHDMFLKIKKEIDAEGAYLFGHPIDETDMEQMVVAGYLIGFQEGQKSAIDAVNRTMGNSS